MSDFSSHYQFIPRRRLRGPHAQTLAGNFLKRTNLLPPGELRVFTVDEHDTGAEIRVQCVCHWQQERERKLTVIIVHGLEGSVESKYVIGTGSKAWAAGMNVVRMNMRNCGDTEALAPTLYHSGLSADVGAVAEELVREDALERIAIVGFSMGGNLALKLAGEWGAHGPSQVKVFAAVSPAMDLAASADALHRWSNRIYEWKFLMGLRNRYRRKANLFPDRYDLSHGNWYSSIREFDDRITARYEGFAGAEDYYTRSSASRVADQIRIPTLIIHSVDDPFIRLLPETRVKLAENPAVTLVETQHGGHCAFLAEAIGYDGRWAEKTVVDFLQATA
jgi:predicted alpha/beta-fold hydrolase